MTDTPVTLGRRQFLSGLTALGGATVLTACDRTPDRKAVTPGDLSGKLAGIDFTRQEREQMVGEIENYLDRLRARRAMGPFENSEAPALVFTPRLPGTEYPTQENNIALWEDAEKPLPDDEADIAFASVKDQGRWLRSGKLSAEDLTRLYLRRIDRYGDRLECFITVLADRAVAEARRADAELAAGQDRGALHGIPYGLKDLFDTKGIRTTWGAMPYKDRVPGDDATLVRHLREAGAVLIGKTSLGALAYGDLWYGGLTRNPWNTDEGSSGSSAGSASATVAGLCSFSIGTETLGSIVSPSARCGAVGLRPTFGRVSRAGGMALCWSLDKVGPICRTTEDTALVLAAITGADPLDPSSETWGFSYDATVDLSELRIGYDPAWFERNKTNDALLEAFDHVKALVASLVETAIPALPYDSLLDILFAESAAAFEDLVLTNKDDLLRWQDDRAWPNAFRGSHMISAVSIVQADRLRRRVMQMMDTVLADIDMLVGPPFAGSLSIITNCTGHPAITLPVGLQDRETMPLWGSDDTPGPIRTVPQNICLWGRLYDEGKLIAVARALEARAGMLDRHPPLYEPTT